MGWMVPYTVSIKPPYWVGAQRRCAQPPDWLPRTVQTPIAAVVAKARAGYPPAPAHEGQARIGLPPASTARSGARALTR